MKGVMEMKCWKCDGTGTTKGWISEPCAYCGGTGEIPDDFTEMMKLKNCKKCGGEAVFSGIFDDPTTYRFPECMKCGARAEGNSVKDSWYERARMWNEQNTQTNEERFCNLSTKEKAKEIYKIAKDDFKELRKQFYGVANDDIDAIAMWLKEKHIKE